MTKKILILFIALTTCIGVFAQAWVKKFPGDLPLKSENVIATADGNYMSTIMTNQGLGSGMGVGVYLLKFDGNGATIWLEKISDEITEDGVSVFESPDGGYFIVSRKDYPGVDNVIVHISKLNTSLTEVASTFVLFDNNTDVSDFSNFIVGAGDDHFHIIGGPSIRKYDLDLNLISEVITDFWMADIKMTPQGDFIGVHNNNEAVFKISADGQVIWETDISNIAFASGGYLIHLLPDNSSMLFSVRAPTSNGTSIQSKIDSDGNILWTKEIISPDLFHAPWKQVQVSDGFISTGYINSEILLEKGNLLLVKTDFEGEVIWEKNIHVDEYETSAFLVPTADDGVVGVTQFYEPGSFTQTYFFRANSSGDLYDQLILGKVGFDMAGNCDISESQNLENWYISAKNNSTDETIYGSTDAQGNYSLSVPTGIYTVTVHPPNTLWEACDNNITVGIVEGAHITRDFPIIAAIDCASMAVQSVLPVARPCFDNNTYYVNYCNEGTITAIDAVVEVTVEEELSYVSSTIPLQSQNENTYSFLVGEVASGECGNFQIDFLVDCETETYKTVCIATEVFPNESCAPDPFWNGAFVEGEVDCEGDSIVFSLINTGTDVMSSARNFIVIEDALMLRQGEYLLESQAEQIEKFAANGSTLILEAMQEEFAPGDPFVKVWIEGCGEDANGEFSTGFVNQYSLGDNNPATDRECRITSSAYDPNDKQGFPLGYGEEHFIRENTDIEYLLRFQNTGNDTAFTVILLDTITTELDLATLRVGPASHDYEWSIESGNVLKVEFGSILLPDSTTNFDASNGFVEFTIAQQPNLPIGTKIKNDVGIYFDFNDVVMTNETLHTIGVDFIEVSTQNPIVEAAKIEVFPNPFNDFTWIKMEATQLENGNFELYDTNGKLVFQQQFSGNQFKFTRNKNIISGNYFYRIVAANNRIINSGQLSIQ